MAYLFTSGSVQMRCHKDQKLALVKHRSGAYEKCEDFSSIFQILEELQTLEL